MFKFRRRPLLNAQGTGNEALVRPYGPAIQSVYGRGGHVPARQFLKLVPMQIVPNRTALPVSVGGSSDLVYQGIGLQTLTDKPSGASQL
jgi:hypothetical protein